MIHTFSVQYIQDKDTNIYPIDIGSRIQNFFDVSNLLTISGAVL